MFINLPDPDVHEVMGMVLGEYIAVFTDILEDQMVSGVITPKEQITLLIRFSKGCRKICIAFGLDTDVYDVDHHLASEFLCKHYEEDRIDGIENNC